MTPKTVPCSPWSPSGSVTFTHTLSVWKLSSHSALSPWRVVVTGRACSVPLFWNLFSINLGERSQDSTQYRSRSICPVGDPWRTGGTESTFQFMSRSHCLPLGLLSSQQKAKVSKVPSAPFPRPESPPWYRQPRILWVPETPRGPLWESALLSISLWATPGAHHFSFSTWPCVKLTPLGGHLHTIRST